MKPADRFALYKEMYWFELNRKEAITSSLNLPVGILAALAGGLLYFVRNVPATANEWRIALYSALCVGTATLLCSAYYLVRCLLGYTYFYIPSPRALETKDFQALQNYYETYPFAEPGLNEDFLLRLIEYFGDATAQNTRNNESKTAHRRNGIVWLVLSVGALALASILLEMQHHTPIGALAVFAVILTLLFVLITARLEQRKGRQ
jgi:hypothetical protein